MSKIYSVEVDKYNPLALASCLEELGNGIPNFEYSWRVIVNAGGIDYGVYLNVNVEREEIEISNQPKGDGEDSIYDILSLFEDDEEE